MKTIAVIVCTVFLGLCVLFAGGFYQVVAGDGFFLRVNKITGDTWVIGRSGVPVQVPYRDFFEGEPQTTPLSSR